MGYRGVQGLQTAAEVPKRRVFLFGVGMELNGKIVCADLMDEMYRASKGKVPIDMIICCPRCGVELNIDGTKKTFRIDYLDRPQRWKAHDGSGMYYSQEALVSIEETLVCSRPIGKTMCGLQFMITENKMHRV